MVRMPRLLGPLGWRLFVAFILSTVGVVAVVALLAVLSVSRQTDTVVQTEQARQRAAIVDAVVEAYRQAGFSWHGANLTGVLALARASGAVVVVQDAAGDQVIDVRPPARQGEDNPNRGGTTEPGHSSESEPSAEPTHSSGKGRGGGSGGSTGSSGSGGGDHFVAPAVAPSSAPPSAPPSAAPGASPVVRTATTPQGATAISVNGRQIGSLTFQPAPASDSVPWQARTAILHTVGVAAGLAVLLAGCAAFVVSRTISRPLVGLAAAARAVEEGVPDATRLLRPGPGELGQVSRAFNQMARTLRREDQLRRALVADVAHELRTPLTILRGQTEQLLDGLAAPSAERLSSLHEEVLRLDSLVEDLATLSAAEAAGLRMDRQPVDIEDVLTRAVTAMRPQYESAQIKLDLHTAAARGYGDPQRLTQVIGNLLANAVKFTPEGGAVTVELRAAGPEAVITVADTGPGVPESDRPHVFDRFWRGQSAGRHAGSGIGLAVVAELVAAHGGTVEVAGAPGGGALFTVRLPLG